ncbi:GDSL-like Lipase/Acylhydrolase family protein [Pseudobutyrivibrio sp. JW11]|uniref:GDSL-type esterase/lipase family protein n=1 Tax=Pseudobutyrivibrio sp. JW11 TaxID=1855302 RepID=UPI0008F2704D|nr:GDSL-type esterase/lipase family protein [Pseudobutyrivibrio sp. JW11]SFO47831.1 GDSL-like Lipase/Acylhydrolase family protein [Pseudobutyrivibrio sp. JW11]
MKINSILLLLLTIISAITIAIVGIVFRTTVYTKYYTNPYETTSIGAVFQAASDNIFPWSKIEVEEKKTVTVTKKTNKKINKIKKYVSVDNSYFDDALFIGDSRMVGLSQYCQDIDARATFYAKKSLSIYNIRDDKWIETEDGEEISLAEALETNHFSKIYIMVGINELGRGDELDFREAYQDVINQIQAAEPDAYIFINSIMHVSGEKNETDELYNNTNINIRNDAIKTLEDRQNIFYLNINEAVDDEEGNLDAETTSDGVHLKGACYEPWHEYLLSHGVE